MSEKERTADIRLKTSEYELFLYDGMSDETIGLGAGTLFAGYFSNNRTHL
jgi:hypothetical protein